MKRIKDKGRRKNYLKDKYQYFIFILIMHVVYDFDYDGFVLS